MLVATPSTAKSVSAWSLHGQRNDLYQRLSKKQHCRIVLRNGCLLGCEPQTGLRSCSQKTRGSSGWSQAGGVTSRPPVIRAVAAPPETPPATTTKQETNVVVSPITKDTWTVQGRSAERLKFEIEYGLKRGTTENSYLVKGTDGTALVDVPDQAFRDAYVEALEKEVALGEVGYLVLGHLSPKRVQTMETLAKARSGRVPPMNVYCSNPAAKTLTSTLPEDLLKEAFEVRVVRPGDTLDLGGGHNLQFILTPTPRWPDGLTTYDPASQLLFSHKFFSAHICEESLFDIGGWDVYGEHWRFFYDCMLAPVAKQTEAVLEKLPIKGQFSQPSYSGKAGLEVVKADFGYIWSSVAKALNLSIGQSSLLSGSASDGTLVVSAICPLHGPIVRSSLTELVREYKEWTGEKMKQAADATIGVIYASAYGNTTAMAQAISRGILKAGVGCESLNCELSSSAEVADLVKRCGGFVLGSPTLAGHMPTPVQEALGVILRDTDARTKPCGVFGSFGWSGEAVDEMEQRLKDGGFNFAFPPIRCKFKPTESMVQVCEESGTDLAQLVRRSKLKQRVQEAPQFTVASGLEQAVGRIVGALCVVTAKSGDAESAMLASWVSQASFNPPGVTVAVAKDRAMEGLVLTGGQFVLNVLGGDKVGPVSKQLLRPFGPGEPRFGDLATKEAPNGAKILEDAIAYMECTVESRMETGDHWVLYAKVTNGNIQNEKVTTAVHHRKTGERY